MCTCTGTDWSQYPLGSTPVQTGPSTPCALHQYRLVLVPVPAAPTPVQTGSSNACALHWYRLVPVPPVQRHCWDKESSDLGWNPLVPVMPVQLHQYRLVPVPLCTTPVQTGLHTRCALHQCRLAPVMIVHLHQYRLAPVTLVKRHCWDKLSTDLGWNPLVPVPSVHLHQCRLVPVMPVHYTSTDWHQ